MKKTALFAMGIMAAGFLSAPPARAAHREDFKVIQKAVKENPATEAGREVKWFKVQITDARTDAVKVKITLPVALVEIAMRCVDDSRIRLDRSDCDIDLRALWAELKKAGPMTVIEVCDDGEIVKVWFE